MTVESTPRLTLPFIQPGQAQKEMSHNEALTLLDIAVQPAVQAVGGATPPLEPEAGQCWIVGAGADGDWAGCETMLAGWTAGGWRFVAPVPGMQVWSVADGMFAWFDGAEWLLGELMLARVRVGTHQVVGARQPAIPDPAGGTSVDAEARGAIVAVLEAMRTHGLVASA